MIRIPLTEPGDYVCFRHDPTLTWRTRWWFLIHRKAQAVEYHQRKRRWGQLLPLSRTGKHPIVLCELSPLQPPFGVIILAGDDDDYYCRACGMHTTGVEPNGACDMRLLLPYAEHPFINRIIEQRNTNTDDDSNRLAESF